MNDKNQGILAKISVEARTEVIKDLFADVAGLIDKSDTKLAKLVEVLKQQKEAVGHGNWIEYLKENFGGDAAVKRVQYYMRKVDNSNSRIFNYLEDGETEPEEPETAPRSERKTGQVEVVEPDDDPPPKPPTNRKTAAGSQKVKEADKPKTAVITPEILPEESFPEERTLSDWSETQILDFLVATADDPKPRAKRLRKTADKLDPPTKFVKPDLDDVSAFFADQKAADPESFFDFYESKGWLVGKVSMKDWRASARKWIRENEANGKANNNGRRTTTTQDPASCLGANGRPEIKHRKINYK